MEDNTTTYYFTINALSHCHWGECPEKLVEQAQRKRVLLVCEDCNVDPNAVRVHFDGQVAGYVCRDDAPSVKALIKREGRQSKLALVTSYITDPYYKLKARVEGVGTTTIAIDDHVNQQYDAWEYTGPLMSHSAEQNLLEGAVEYLSFVIDGELPWDAVSNAYFETFLRYHRYDYSDEMFHFRHHLVKFFECQSGMERERLCMENEFHEMSKHEHQEWIGRYTALLPGTPEFMQMMRSYGNIDLNTLTNQMAAFPGNLTGLLLNDAALFSRRLYYIHPRRKVLRQFYSGIAILLFFKKSGLLENLSGSQSAFANPKMQYAKPLQTIDRLANQLNLVLGDNSTTGYNK